MSAMSSSWSGRAGRSRSTIWRFSVLCITAKGKPIKAKTLGQKKYIEAIQNNVVTLGIGPA